MRQSDANSRTLLADYYRLMSCNGADQVYRTAVDSGLLDTLRDATRSTEDVAEAIGAAPRPVGLVCEVLASLGLVQGGDAGWRLTALGDNLVRGPYRNLGDPYWSHLPDFMGSDAPIAQMDDPSESEARYRGQAAALAWMLGPAAAWAGQHVTSTLDPSAPLDILDVGAGSAIWSLSCAARLPEARVTAADWPGVLEVATATAARMGLSDRLTLLPGDLATVELPQGNSDLTILANVAHLLEPDGLDAMLHRLAATLRLGGRLVVIDIMPGAEEGDLSRTLYALGLALRTRSGCVHDVAYLKTAMIQAGLDVLDAVPIDETPHTLGMMIGRRFD